MCEMCTNFRGMSVSEAQSARQRDGSPIIRLDDEESEAHEQQDHVQEDNRHSFQLTTHNGLRDFPLFPDAAVELRLQIWEAALPGPRLLEVRVLPIYNPDCEDRGTFLEAIAQNEPPVLLRVNTEAREVVLRSYGLELGNTLLRPIWFNWGTDGLYMERSDTLAILLQARSYPLDLWDIPLAVFDPLNYMGNRYDPTYRLIEFTVDDDPNVYHWVYKMASFKEIVFVKRNKALGPQEIVDFDPDFDLDLGLPPLPDFANMRLEGAMTRLRGFFERLQVHWTERMMASGLTREEVPEWRTPLVHSLTSEEVLGRATFVRCYIQGREGGGRFGTWGHATNPPIWSSDRNSYNPSPRTPSFETISASSSQNQNDNSTIINPEEPSLEESVLSNEQDDAGTDEATAEITYE